MRMVTEPTSTLEMPEPCIAMDTPIARILPFGSVTGFAFASQSIICLTRARQRSSAHEVAVSP